MTLPDIKGKSFRSLENGLCYRKYRSCFCPCALIQGLGKALFIERQSLSPVLFMHLNLSPPKHHFYLLKMEIPA